MDDYESTQFIRRLDKKLRRIDYQALSWQQKFGQANSPEQSLQIKVLRRRIADLRSDLASSEPGLLLDIEKDRLQRAWDDIKVTYQSVIRSF